MTIFIFNGASSLDQYSILQRLALCKIWTQIYCVKFTAQQTAGASQIVSNIQITEICYRNLFKTSFFFGYEMAHFFLQRR